LFGYPVLLGIDRRGSAKAAALAPLVGLLEQLELFATASRPVLERLAGAAIQEEFATGAAVIREGEPADALYVLVEGEVEVTARGEVAGAQRRLRTMTAPSYFGEIGVLAGIPRTATVTTLSACRCARIDGEALLGALTATPPSSSLMEVARSRLAVTHPSRRITYV
jgi:CRP-like cAMP-binding protein